MNIRLAKIKNKVTRESIKSRAEKDGLTMRAAKRIEENERTVLQVMVLGVFVDVPVVELIREVNCYD